MNSNNKNIVITSAVRTAVGTFKGSLKNMQGHDLGSVVVKGAIEKSKLKMNEVRSPEILEEVETLSSEPETPGKRLTMKLHIPDDLIYLDGHFLMAYPNQLYQF